jgi:hypothetical protein
MNPNYWNRLVHAARRAPAEASADMPFGFDARVISRWKTGARRAEDIWSGVWVLRGALVCSALIMLVSLLVNSDALSRRELAGADTEPAGIAIVNSALQITMAP